MPHSTIRPAAEDIGDLLRLEDKLLTDIKRIPIDYAEDLCALLTIVHRRLAPYLPRADDETRLAHVGAVQPPALAPAPGLSSVRAA